eukprot:1159902-Pelagomonas_calceolata.AAC.9
MVACKGDHITSTRQQRGRQHCCSAPTRASPAAPSMVRASAGATQMSTGAASTMIIVVSAGAASTMMLACSAPSMMRASAGTTHS